MKTLLRTLLISCASALIAVAIYSKFMPIKQIIYQPISPQYINYGQNFPKGQIMQKNSSSVPPNNFIYASQRATPGVVFIQSTQKSNWFGQSYNTFNGSGVIITNDGYIVTNYHVIEDASIIEITLPDKRQYPAKLIGKDPSTDLALIKIEATNLSPLVFGNSDSLQVGEWVLAVGNPFNLESTVTAGIVSAKGRNINILGDNTTSIESFIQTDAVVNPGNSGGALINSKGELVAINTAIITQSGGYEGYSFAIPSNLALKVIEDLRDYGEVKRGILGVNITDVNDKLAKEMDLNTLNGVMITGIFKESGAEKAGLNVWDIIISIDGKKVNSIPELQEVIARYHPGNSIEIEYIRKNTTLKTQVILKEKDLFENLVKDELSLEKESLLSIGLELKDLGDDELEKLGKTGVKVIGIIQDTPISATNMDPGFIIQKLNDKTIQNMDQLTYELIHATGEIVLEGFYEEFEGEYFYSFTKE